MTDDDLREQLKGLAGQLNSLAEKADTAASHRVKQDRKLENIETRLAAVEQATATDFWKWIVNHWKAAVALTPLITAILVVFTSGVWYLYGDTAVRFLQAELRLAALENEVLYQPPGLSFVRSPVEQGGAAEYILVARRTTSGLRCIYVNTVPVFTDELGRTLVGDFETRGRQFNGEMTRTELRLPVPPGLLSGRVLVILQITYDCNDIMVNQETYPVSFELRENPPE